MPPTYSEHTSVQRRIATITKTEAASAEVAETDSMLTDHVPLPLTVACADAFLSLLTTAEYTDLTGPCASESVARCSDRGFLTM